MTRDSLLLSIVFTDTSNTEVAGLGCIGVNGMIVMNGTIFGKLTHFIPLSSFTYFCCLRR